MVTRMFLKMMMYLTIGVASVNYLIEDEKLRGTLPTTGSYSGIDDKALFKTHRLID